ncbi:MAG: ADP-forming succinate--CoA ligase subunit beta [Armatimonadetes bacterium]|nr:ADP-forming succinate--CoA ligase subunit beta [Armatimonadota bacterium]
MKLHEHQAKDILSHYHVPIPRGEVARDSREVYAIAQKFGKPVAIKAQVLVGGRGKAGGVKLADNPDHAESRAREILGMDIKGLMVRKVLVEEALSIAQEFYMGITNDRTARRSVMMLSAMGGMDIEEVAHSTPEKIAKLHLDPNRPLADFQIRSLIYGANVPPRNWRDFVAIARSLHIIFTALDASLVEINPLVITGEGSVIAGDAKIVVDDNALYRQSGVSGFQEKADEDPLEQRAREKGLHYVRLSGNIGIIGNGAGLVMTTLDQVSQEGGAPANFLDVGGGAKSDVVKAALEIVSSDPHVEGIFVNIFGGITRCDDVANGIIQALSHLKLECPLVFRLSGTNEAEGKKILGEANLIPAASMQEGARRIVDLVKERTEPESIAAAPAYDVPAELY